MIEKNMLQNLSIADFTDKLACAKECVGGGSASALTGLLAAGLLKMAIAHTLSGGNNDKILLAEKNNRLLFLEAELLNLIAADAAALAKLIAGAALDGNPNEGAMSAEMARNLENAARVPLQTAACCLEALEIALAILPIIEHNLKSELMTAVANAHAGATGALMSVALNLGYILNKELVGELTAAIKKFKSAVDEVKEKCEQLVFADYPFSVFNNF